MLGSLAGKIIHKQGNVPLAIPEGWNGNDAGERGLSMKSKAPDFMQRTAVSTLSSAVTTTTGTLPAGRVGVPE